MSRALSVLREERAALLRQVRGIEVAIGALRGKVERKLKAVAKKGKKMSEATKAKIRASMKKRWSGKKKS